MTKKTFIYQRLAFINTLVVACFISASAHAEIYKHVDAEGRVTYSNVKIKGAKKLYLEPADTSFGNASDGETKRAPSAKTPTPASFPKVDAGTQNQRDGKRKEILQAELATERQALEEAKKAYAEGESKPEVYQTSRQVTSIVGRTADGKPITKTSTVTNTNRNVPKFQEKMKALQENVDAHQRNIQLLEKEISSIN
jgi:hypothetical protein